MALVSRDEIRGVLERWRSGEVGHRYVLDWATERFQLEQMDSGDPIVNEVLAERDNMHVMLTTPDDVPILLRILNESDPGDARRMLQIYGDDLDLEVQYAKWKKDAFYRPFFELLGKPNLWSTQKGPLG